MTSISGPMPAVPGSNPYPASSGDAKAAPAAGLSAIAVSLASDAGVIATLGATPVAGQTYDARGLLNSLVQAGSAAAGASQEGAGTSAADAQAYLDQAVLGSLSGAPAAPSLYSVSGGLQSATVDVNSNFASILKTDPGAAGTVVSDSFNQGIIGSISTSA